MQADNRTKLITLFIVLGALSRLIPHPLNFTPVAAMALFGGTYILNKRLAFFIPMATLFLSDIVMQLVNGTGFYQDMIFVYGAMALMTMIGFFLRGKDQRPAIMVASLTGSILFFVITNFGTWTTGLYGYTLEGLRNCYVAAIPFFRGTIMGDLFYNTLFFGGFALLRWAKPSLIKQDK
ncbi:MAG: DUF6580 family putative transport protein [Bacteroidia bacterium]